MISKQPFYKKEILKNPDITIGDLEEIRNKFKAYKRAPKYKKLCFARSVDAWDILEDLRTEIRKNGQVSVFDFCQMANVFGWYDDQKYGWTDLSEAKISECKRGYKIKFPKLLILDVSESKTGKIGTVEKLETKPDGLYITGKLSTDYVSLARDIGKKDRVSVGMAIATDEYEKLKNSGDLESIEARKARYAREKAINEFEKGSRSPKISDEEKVKLEKSAFNPKAGIVDKNMKFSINMVPDRFISIEEQQQELTKQKELLEDNKLENLKKEEYLKNAFEKWASLVGFKNGKQVTIDPVTGNVAFGTIGFDSDKVGFTKASFYNLPTEIPSGSKSPHLSSATTPEPDPIENPNMPILWDMVAKDMLDRKMFGFSKYHKHLRPHNGRKALWDAYQELLDLVVYLRQYIYELDNPDGNKKS